MDREEIVLQFYQKQSILNIFPKTGSFLRNLNFCQEAVMKRRYRKFHQTCSA